MHELIRQARACLEQCDPSRKVAMTYPLAERFRQAGDGVDTAFTAQHAQPGRPARPALVHPAQVARRNLATVPGRAAFLHALAHIEFNAINLGWDAVCRFPGMPAAYYRDWSRVAQEEALHFSLLAGQLQALGYRYGDFPAHDGLWEMARKTAHDPLVRMALVPRVLEARGLDVTPGMLERLRAVGDLSAVRILERILEDEIGHVETGSRWFGYLCRQRGLDPADTFQRLLALYGMQRVRKPLNEAARTRAGFDRRELDMLKHWAEGNP